MMVLRAAYCKVQSLAVMFQFAGFNYCTPEVASSSYCFMRPNIHACMDCMQPELLIEVSRANVWLYRYTPAYLQLPV